MAAASQVPVRYRLGWVCALRILDSRTLLLRGLSDVPAHPLSSAPFRPSTGGAAALQLPADTGSSAGGAEECALVSAGEECALVYTGSGLRARPAFMIPISLETACKGIVGTLPLSYDLQRAIAAAERQCLLLLNSGDVYLSSAFCCTLLDNLRAP
ncbi:hypothetical protein WJX73_000308 [Symbiochloris irregularis]|uniref:Uncharacterized protein n=1 Tax=Symbiochloris irregularis TaxID=706552 RepID=A0AAW1P980_9CHLO